MACELWYKDQKQLSKTVLGEQLVISNCYNLDIYKLIKNRQFQHEFFRVSWPGCPEHLLMIILHDTNGKKELKMVC